jgi:hypothetical protein
VDATVDYTAEVAQLVEQPIRNRQVPGSSPGLGSSIPFPCRGLRISIRAHVRLRRKNVASSEFFAEQVHRAFLRLTDSLHVDIHRQPHVAVTENPLNRLVGHL